MVGISKEIRSWIVLLLAIYVMFNVVIPAIDILLFAEQVANDAITATIDTITDAFSYEEESVITTTELEPINNDYWIMEGLF